MGTVAAEAAIRIALDTFDGLDVLVNNTGHGDVHSVEDTALDDFWGQRSRNPTLIGRRTQWSAWSGALFAVEGSPKSLARKWS